MKDTRLKLEEAAFFLGLLEPNFGKDKKFDYYLSAFLSAARAVTWIMRSEYGKVAGWEAWYDALKPDAEEERLLDGITGARNRSLKGEPLRTLGEVTVFGLYSDNGDVAEAKRIFARMVDERMQVTMNGNTLEAVVDGRPIKISFRQVMLNRNLKEFPDQHIPSVCTRYYRLLSKIVDECEAKFGR